MPKKSSKTVVKKAVKKVVAEVKENLTLANPIAEQLAHMRPNLIIGLMQSYQKNYLRSFSDVSFFEIGKVFLGTKENEQKQMIAGLRAGKNNEQNHYNDCRDFDIFDVKKDIFNCLSEPLGSFVTVFSFKIIVSPVMKLLLNKIHILPKECPSVIKK